MSEVAEWGADLILVRTLLEKYDADMTLGQLAEGLEVGIAEAE